MAAGVGGLRIDAATGLLAGVRQVLSPHFDARPPGALPELLVVHGISLPPGEFGGPWIDRLFTGTLPADAHPSFARARRACVYRRTRSSGVTARSCSTCRSGSAPGTRASREYRGRPACNDFSIGVELEGADDIPYTEAQYVALAALATALLEAYPPLSAHNIVGHSDIAPGRKTDPGPAFDVAAPACAPGRAPAGLGPWRS